LNDFFENLNQIGNKKWEKIIDNHDLEFFVEIKKQKMDGTYEVKFGAF